SIGEGAKVSIPELLKVIREDSRDVTRNLALEALKKIGPPDRNDTSLLRECLKDRDARIRTYGAMAMAQLGSDASSALSALVPVAKGSNVEARQNATRALGKMGTDANE